MSKKIIQLNEGAIKDELKELVRGSVEETLNDLLEKEAQELTQAAKYERTEARQGYRSGHYNRNLTTTSGDVTLKMPRLKGIPFETAIIERYRRRESSVEEALIEMYLAGVSVRRVEDITEALWGTKVSPATISELNKKAYVHIEAWRNRPLRGGTYPYVYVDGIYLRRNWGGEFENVSILVALGVNEDGYREVIGAAEGMKEDKASWTAFLQWLKGRGLDGVRLIVGDKCLGMLEAAAEVFPQAKYQRCTVHFYRNVFSATPRSKMKLVARMLKAIHAQESKAAAREKAVQVAEALRAMKLKEAAKKVEDGIEETLTYMEFPSEHWLRIRTNNVIERLNREIRRRTRVVGTFPDGNSALMLVCARLRHVAGTQWGNKKYMNMKHLEIQAEPVALKVLCKDSIVGWSWWQDRALPSAVTVTRFASDGQGTCLDHPAVTGRSLKRHVNAVAEINHQLHQDIAPILDRHCPAVRDLHGDQIQLLEQRVVADKRAFRFCNLAKLTVEIFDCVGRIDHPPNLFGIFVHGGKLVPMIPPGFHARRIFRAPDAFQLVQRQQGGFLGRRFVDGLERSCERLNVLVRDISRGTADLMDDAALDFCLRISGGDGFRKAVQSVDRYQQNVRNAAIFQAVQHAQPVF